MGMGAKQKFSIILVFTFFFLVLFVSTVSAARLPIVGGDSNQWGSILNEYLNVSHNESGELRNNTVSSANIIDGTITANDLAPSSVNTTHIVDNTITASDLENEAVTNAKISSNAVNTTQIIDGTITANDLAPSSVNTTHIVDNTITASDIGLDIIDGAQLADTITLDAMLNFINNNFSVNTSDFFVDVSNGRVGIGTTNPSHELHVNGSANVSGTTFSGKLNTSEICIGTDCRTSWPSGGEISPWTNDTSQIFVRPGHPNYINASNTLFVNGTSGNVGIGTTTPGAKLHVIHPGETQISYTARFQSSPTTAGAGGILFDQGSTFAYKWHTEGTSATVGRLLLNYINVSDGSVVHGPILGIANGNVGIGTTAPSEKLDVNGNLKVSGTVSGLSNSIVYKNCSATALNDASCTASCDAGYKVIGGGCSAAGSSTPWNQVFETRPTSNSTGWICRTTVDWDHSATMVATGYAICLKQ